MLGGRGSRVLRPAGCTPAAAGHPTLSLLHARTLLRALGRSRRRGRDRLASRRTIHLACSPRAPRRCPPRSPRRSISSALLAPIARKQEPRACGFGRRVSGAQTQATGHRSGEGSAPSLSTRFPSDWGRARPSKLSFLLSLSRSLCASPMATTTTTTTDAAPAMERQDSGAWTESSISTHRRSFTPVASRRQSHLSLASRRSSYADSHRRLRSIRSVSVVSELGAGAFLPLTLVIRGFPSEQN